MATSRVVTKFWGGLAAYHLQVSWESQVDRKLGLVSKEVPDAVGGDALLLR